MKYVYLTLMTLNLYMVFERFGETRTLIPAALAIGLLVAYLYEIRFFDRGFALLAGYIDGTFLIIPTIIIFYTQCNCFGVRLAWGNVHIEMLSQCVVKSEG